MRRLGVGARRKRGNIIGGGGALFGAHRGIASAHR